VSREGDAAPIESNRHRVNAPAQRSRVLNNGVEHWLDIGRRTRDDAKNIGRGRLLIVDLGQCLPEIFDGGLGIICIGRRDRASFCERITAFLAELPLRAILVLAPGTVHI
jgi:hypothetical protein